MRAVMGPHPRSLSAPERGVTWHGWMKALTAAALALLLFLVWRKHVSAPDRAGDVRFDMETMRG